MSDLVLVSIAFALFIVCPRMAGMAAVISRATNLSLIKIAVFGSLFSIPLTIIMVLVFRRWGLIGALSFCVLTDLGSALLMREINLKAGLETLVVALFVLLGVKVASWISALVG